MRYFVDRFTLEEVQRSRAAKESLNKYFWDYHNELAYQRQKIIHRLRTSLLKAATGPFPFEKWQRTVKLRWAVQPLACKGSMLSAGGRFNFGEIAPSFAPFPALYIAKDRTTSLCELLGQNINRPGKMSPYEIALTDETSIAVAVVSGSLESIIDFNHQKELQDFVDLIKTFKISNHLVKTARKLKIQQPILIRNLHQLMQTLLEENWRTGPMQFDVPAPCQIFGELIASAGIEGILYPSKFTGENCLAIFPKAFKSPASFVKMIDLPPAETTITTLDLSNIDRLC